MYSLEAYKTLIKKTCYALDNNSIEIKSGTIRLDYSGRGMYGRECLGIVLSQYDMELFKFDFMDSINDVIKNHNDDSVALFKKMKAALRSPSKDSMGLSAIDYYTSINIPNEYQAELKEIISGFIYQD